jgi:hypothetical protein
LIPPLWGSPGVCVATLNMEGNVGKKTKKKKGRKKSSFLLPTLLCVAVTILFSIPDVSCTHNTRWNKFTTLTKKKVSNWRGSGPPSTREETFRWMRNGRRKEEKRCKLVVSATSTVVQKYKKRASLYSTSLPI